MARIDDFKRARVAIDRMTNWQNTRYMREVAEIRDLKQIADIAERWADTPRRDVSGETNEGKTDV